MTKKAMTKAAKKTPALSDKEREVGLAFLKARDEYPSMPSANVDLTGGTKSISIDYPNKTIGAMMHRLGLGVANEDFYLGALRQLADATNPKEADAQWFNFALASIAGIKPTDPVESMLAIQMTTIHMAMMEQARRMNLPDQIPEARYTLEKSMNRLARTFNQQIETLKKYRSKGEQRVIVERVDVHNGGQAMVGTVNTGGRGNDENDR